MAEAEKPITYPVMIFCFFQKFYIKSELETMAQEENKSKDKRQLSKGKILSLISAYRFHGPVSKKPPMIFVRLSSSEKQKVRSESGKKFHTGDVSFIAERGSGNHTRMNIGVCAIFDLCAPVAPALL